MLTLPPPIHVSHIALGGLRHIARVLGPIVYGVFCIGGAIFFTFGNCPSSSPPDSARNHAYELSKSVELFRLRHGEYPSLVRGLGALAENDDGKGALIERVPLDPWGHSYRYVIPGDHNPSKFDVASAGPDETFGTDDDVGNWPEGDQ